MIRIYAIVALVVTSLVGGLGSCAYIEHQKATTQALRDQNAILQGNQKALEKKIETDAKVSANDAARAAADAQRILKHKETSRVIVQGTKNPGHVALDADATQRVRDIFAQH
jgi:hypothetical protein